MVVQPLIQYEKNKGRNMKNIFINNPKITRDQDTTYKLQQALQQKFRNSAFHIEGAEVFSDIQYNNLSDRQEKTLNSILQYVLFVAEYINQILYDNETAERRKASPYALFISIIIDFKNLKSKIHFYLDGNILGLVAGSGYSNISSLIKTSFPIYSKMGADVEFKLFPLNTNTNQMPDSSFSEDYD